MRESNRCFVWVPRIQSVNRVPSCVRCFRVPCISIEHCGTNCYNPRKLDENRTTPTPRAAEALGNRITRYRRGSRCCKFGADVDRSNFLEKFACMSRTSKYAHPHPKDEQNQYLVVIIDHNCRLVIVQYSDSNQPRWKHKIWVQEGKLALIQWTIAVALASIARNFCVVEWHTKGRAKEVKSAVGLCFSCLLPTRTRMHPHAHTHTRTHTKTC